MSDKRRREYTVSIITPCKEAELHLLQKTLESLKRQTLGFDNIEWIVVVHNSSTVNLKQVEDIVAPYPNIRIYKLRDDFHTPSSPKNFALSRVRGEFVTFLDADDFLADRFLEEAVSRFDNDEIDAVFCAYETLMDEGEERLKIHMAKELSGESVRIMGSGIRRDSDFMQGSELTTTGKVYRWSVLEENNIRYDAKVPIAEDVLFNLNFMKCGRNICLMKDFVGYYYYLRENSAIQSMNKPPEEVIRCAKGFVKVLDFGFVNGFFMDNILLDFLGLESAFMLVSLNLNKNQRKEIKELCKPCIERMSAVRPSGRYNKKLLKILKTLPKIVILHPCLMGIVAGIMRLFHIDIEKKIRRINDGK